MSCRTCAERKAIEEAACAAERRKDVRCVEVPSTSAVYPWAWSDSGQRATQPRVRLDRDGQQPRTCHVCIARHIESYKNVNEAHVTNLRSYIQHDQHIALSQSLRHGYPPGLLLEMLFLAVEHQSWASLSALLDERSANVWIQCYNDRSENLVQKILCKHRPDPSVVGGIVCEVLHRLQQSMDATALKVYVNKMWQPKVGDDAYLMHKNGLTLLHMATIRSQIECVLELLNSGANPNLKDGNNRTPLMMAARDKNIEIMEILIDFGSNVSTTCGYEETALTLYLGRLPKKAKLTSHQKRGLKLLLRAAETVHMFEYKMMLGHMDDDVMMLMVDNGLPVCYRDSTLDEEEPLSRSDTKHWAYSLTAGLGDQDTVETLSRYTRELAIDVNRSVMPPQCLCEDIEYDCCGCTPLQTACRSGYYNNVDCLLHSGAEPDVSGEHGRFPLLHVIEYRRTGAMKCAKLLLRYGCQVNVACPIDIHESQSSNWLFPLDFFLLFNQLYIVKMLLVAGATKYCPELHLAKLDYQGVMIMVDRPQTLEREFIPVTVCPESMRRDVLSQLQLVPSLYHLSRVAVRHALHSDIYNKVKSLPYPPHILDYLNLEELDVIERAYSRVESRLVQIFHFPDSEYEDMSDDYDSDTSSDMSDHNVQGEVVDFGF